MKTKNNIQANISIGMIRLALASLFIAVVFASCSKDEIAPSSSNNQSSEASSLRARSFDNTAVAVAEQGIAFASMSHFERGSGKSFEAKVWASGIVEIKAISNLPFHGTIRYSIPSKSVQAIREVFLRNGFDRLEAEYPGKRGAATSVTTFVSCPECESLIVRSVTDHGIRLPEQLIKIKASVSVLMQLDKHINGGIGNTDNTAAQVDGTLSN